jgi:FixJ family two-component response regulator
MMMSAEKLVHIVDDDDDDAVRRSAAFMLKHAGYKVESYVSGVTFLKEVKRAERGCVLLDVRMPEMDGLEVQAELGKRKCDWRASPAGNAMSSMDWSQAIPTRPLPIIWAFRRAP